MASLEFDNARRAAYRGNVEKSCRILHQRLQQRRAEVAHRKTKVSYRNVSRSIYR